MPGFNSDDSAFRRLLAEARDGDDGAVGELLNQYRDYLLLIANQQMDRKVRGKVGGSDIVQESMLAAQQGFAQFQGESPEQLMAWLKKILINDVYATGRRYRQTAKREVGREVQISTDSTQGLPLVDPNNTPKTDALVQEQSRQLREAMQGLPDEYRSVLELRNWDQLSFAEIGRRMDRSENAARKLWTRAVMQLQKSMAE